MKVPISQLKLDDLGRVVLDDDSLSEISSLSVTFAGGDNQTNGGTCTNAAACHHSTNAQCTNANNQCWGAVNRTGCVPGQQNQNPDEQEEIDP